MSPANMKEDFLSAVGYGAMMGLLKNYEVLNPFISATIDSFKRLKPGFEAPICIVTSLGLAPSIPSRNRTVLAGLVRDIDNPKATRIEMRSPNPFTNTYLAIAVFYLAALDGIVAAINSGMSLKELEKDISKKSGEKSFYLETNREYRTEADVFEDFTEEARAKLFGKPPATVWENMEAFQKYPEKTAVLTKGGTMKPIFVHSFMEGALARWKTELLKHLIPGYIEDITRMKKLHAADDVNKEWDDKMWKQVVNLRTEIAQDTMNSTSLFTQIAHAIKNEDFDRASSLQIELMAKMEDLTNLYHSYAMNIF